MAPGPEVEDLKNQLRGLQAPQGPGQEGAREAQLAQGPWDVKGPGRSHPHPLRLQAPTAAPQSPGSLLGDNPSRFLGAPPLTLQPVPVSASFTPACSAPTRPGPPLPELQPRLIPSPEPRALLATAMASTLTPRFQGAGVKLHTPIQNSEGLALLPCPLYSGSHTGLC